MSVLRDLFDKVKRNLGYGFILSSGGESSFTVTEAYQNPWVVGGLEAIAKALSAVKVVDEEGFFERGNTNFTGFMRFLVYDLYIHGNFYVYTNKLKSKLVSWYVLPPSSISIKVSPNFEVEYFLHKENVTNNIIHFKRIIPNESGIERIVKGDSVVKAILPSIYLYNILTRFEIRSFSRNLMPPIAIVNKTGFLNANDREIFLKQLKNKIEQGDLPFFYLEGDTDIVSLQLSGSERIQELKLTLKDEILEGLGVTKVMLSDVESINYANSREQYRIFYVNTILPLLSEIEETFKSAGINIVFDRSSIDVLQDTWKDKIQSAVALWGMGYSLNEVAEIFNLPKPKINDSDYPENDGNLNENKDEEGNKNIIVKTKNEINIADIQIKNYSFRQKRDKMFRELLTKYVAEGLKEFSNTTLDEIKKAYEDWDKAKITNLVNTFFDKRDKILKNLAHNYYRITLREYFDKVNVPRVPRKAYADWKDILEFVIEDHANKITRINKTMRERIQMLIEEALQDDRPVLDLADDIIKEFKLQRNRANTIARTEITSVIEDANYRIATKNKMKTKIWITSLDEHVRESHTNLHGVEVLIADTFPNGLSYPGDENASDPSEVINCRCTVVYNYDSGIEG